MSLKAVDILEHVAAAHSTVNPTEIGEKTGIPSATVTRLLAKLVSEGYLTKVSHGLYRPGRKLRSFLGGASARRRNGSAGTLALLASSSIVSDEVYQGISEVTGDGPYRCVLQPIGGDRPHESGQVAAVLREAAGAIYLAQGALPQPLASELERLGVPVVHAGYSGPENCDTVCWNEHGTYYEMTRRMIERGAAPVIYIGQEWLHQEKPSFRARLRGYRDAMLDHQLEPNVRLVSGGAASVSRVTKEAASTRGTGTAPACFMLSTCEMVGSVSGILAGQEMMPNREVSICSVHLARKREESPEVLHDLALRAEEPWTEIGRVAAQRLLARLAGDDAAPQFVQIRAEIVESQTTVP